ncbi:MAG: efflux transporter periplasmic adaptor subunit [Pelodictyon luteolum]|uniref:Efflux transporter periplasmic adaptor subunit n=1 Tax=Pelodictyon luteolum TaxID=1100 RepID=A0A165M9I5_PELLU|nr:HlyD family secretion protein [Pelodictyon luteolum]KZK74977.1 MAG: efflux transporter periplasmic adaptor subunit [Pelodictyon luteolum]
METPEQQRKAAPEVPDAASGKKSPIGLVKMAVLGALATIGLVWAGQMIQHSFLYEETDNAQIEGDIYPVISRVPGKVLEVTAEDNRLVKKGEQLIALDSLDFVVRRDEARAALKNAEAAAAGARASITAASADEKKLQADLLRSRNLQRQDVISKAELDAVTAGALGAGAGHAEAESRYRAALAQVELRQAELRNAELQLSYTSIKAPANGHISRKNVQPGQFVQPGQHLIALVGSGRLWVVANFKETQMEKMRPGQKVSIRVDAFPGETYEGTVESISAGTGAKFSLLPPDNASGNFVKVAQRVPVKIVFDRKPERPLSTGMNVVVDVRVD